MKPTTKILILLTLIAAAVGCAEKKKRVWIEPPIGFQTGDKNNRKLYYQVEDVRTGRKENLAIPIEQMPENLVVEDQTKRPVSGEDALAAATKADVYLNEQKVAMESPGSKPSVSYLLGIQEIETLYQKASFTEALVRIAPLIEQYPQQPRLHIMQGTLYRKLGEKKMALKAYERAKELDQNNAFVEEAILKLQDEVDSGGST